MYLFESHTFADASDMVREQVWLEVCQAAFDVLLEGFSRVRKVSQEGRTTMIRDTFVLKNALDSVHSCNALFAVHVESFVHASSLPEDEMMEWIRENWSTYAYRHMHGLLTQTLTSVLNTKKIKDATFVVDNLYDLNGPLKDDGPSNSGLSMFTASGGFSMREESKLTNLLSQRLYRS